MREKVVMVSIVIPLYNEEDNVDSYEVDLFPVIDKIAKEYNTTFDFIFVNDGSKDRTLEKITAIAARRKDVQVLNHEKNRGMGAALRGGIVAQRHGGPRYRMLMTDISADKVRAPRGCAPRPWTGTGLRRPG